MDYTPLNYEGFEQYLIKETTHKYWGGFQYEFAFDNKYGVRVLKHDESFGNVCDLFEIEILFEGKMTYDTIIEQGYVGWLTNEDVIDFLEQIMNK